MYVSGKDLECVSGMCVRDLVCVSDKYLECTQGSQIHRRKCIFWCKVNPSQTIAQTPCIHCTQKSPDMYDRICFN